MPSTSPQPPANPVPLRPPPPYALSLHSHRAPHALHCRPKINISSQLHGCRGTWPGKLGSILVPATRFVADRLACLMPCTHPHYALFISSTSLLRRFCTPYSICGGGDGNIMTALGIDVGCRTLLSLPIRRQPYAAHRIPQISKPFH